MTLLESHEQRLLGSGSRTVPVEIFQNQPGARSGDRSIPVLLPLAAMHMDDLRGHVHVGDLHAAQFRVRAARLGIRSTTPVDVTGAPKAVPIMSSHRRSRMSLS